MEDLVFSAQQIRKKLWWIVPLFSSMLVLCWWIFFDLFVPSLEEIAESAPSVEIWPGGLIAPFLGVVVLCLIVLGIMRAIPCREIWIQRAERVLLALTLALIAAMFLVIFAAPFVQGHYMPKLGYTKCTLLQGNPSMWFTDWVKNPEWCVRGKDRAWVHEQAGAAPPKF